MNKKMIIMLIGFGLMVGMISTAYAATSGTTTVEFTVLGGSLGITEPDASIDFNTITIDGSQVVRNANLGVLVVEDLTGAGSGWNVTVEASQFSDGTNLAPTSILTLQGISSVTPDGTSSPSPNIVSGAPYVLDGGSAKKILSAAVNEGMGKYQVQFVPDALRLTVNTSELKESVLPYQSTVTWSIVSGP
jgi:hypothetical protein